MKHNADRFGVIEECFNKECLIITLDNDRVKTPHFHIIDKKTFGENFDVRIMIKKAKYVSNRDKRLTANQIKELIKVLSTKSGAAQYRTTNWKWVVMNWDASNANKLDVAPIMPDYTTLK